MTAEPNAKNDPGPSKPQPGEEFFQQSIADLSRRLGDRAGRQAASVRADAEARRAALQAYDLAQARRLRRILTAVAAVAATACVAWFVVIIGAPDTSEKPGTMASNQPAPPVAMASTAPPSAPRLPTPFLSTSPPPPSEPSPAASLPSAAMTTPVAPPPTPPDGAPPPRPAASPAAAAPPGDPSEAQPAPAAPPPLGRTEILEVQKRLRAIGFDPGTIDGVSGPQTEVAVQHYLESRGLPQMPPTDRELLDQLRQHPAPPVAQAQATQRTRRYDQRSAQASATPPARRSFDPFEPVKVAGTQITQWLQSVFR